MGGQIVPPSSQLALAVQLSDEETFTCFFGEKNTEVLEQLSTFIYGNEQTQEQPTSTYLFGASGSGKTHLLHASCTYAEQKGLSSLCLSFSDLTEFSVDVLDGLESIDVICLDDIQYIAEDEEWQRAVFDLYNRVSEQNKRLIIAGNKDIQSLGITLPDLVSRLSWGYVVQPKMLDDNEKLLVLQYRARQRGIFLSDDVAKYLLNHLSREMKSLIISLDTLDKASIIAQRKITIPFIKETLL